MNKYLNEQLLWIILGGGIMGFVLLAMPISIGLALERDLGFNLYISIAVPLIIELLYVYLRTKETK